MRRPVVAFVIWSLAVWALPPVVGGDDVTTNGDRLSCDYLTGSRKSDPTEREPAQEFLTRLLQKL